jgi:hypothetical protein
VIASVVRGALRLPVVHARPIWPHTTSILHTTGLRIDGAQQRRQQRQWRRQDSRLTPDGNDASGLAAAAAATPRPRRRSARAAPSPGVEWKSKRALWSFQLNFCDRTAMVLQISYSTSRISIQSTYVPLRVSPECQIPNPLVQGQNWHLLHFHSVDFCTNYTALPGCVIILEFRCE